VETVAVEIQYENHRISLTEGETVLEAIERTGLNVPSSCRAGVCHFCLLKATTGPIPKVAQEGLDRELSESGHFKSCVCRPEASLVCEPANSASFTNYVEIESIESIGFEIVKVTFAMPDGFEFRPGQFATFRTEDGHARSYSIASVQSDQTKSFDIHVRRIPNGKLSGWFHSHARPGDLMWMEGAKGKCYYKPDKPKEDLLLVGTGTGMAPLFAIASDAVAQKHQGKIKIIQGALSEDRLYLVDHFRDMQELTPNLDYQSCVLNGKVSDHITIGDLRSIALNTQDSYVNHRIYLCGDPGLVRHLKKHFFLAGASLKNIHADPFIGTETTQNRENH
jgi:ferredoxin-NADP reductase/ferredoxin